MKDWILTLRNGKELTIYAERFEIRPNGDLVLYDKYAGREEQFGAYAREEWKTIVSKGDEE